MRLPGFDREKILAAGNPPKSPAANCVFGCQRADVIYWGRAVGAVMLARSARSDERWLQSDGNEKNLNFHNFFI
jgi:hypothetical protein